MTPNNPTPGDELVERLRQVDLWLSAHYDDEAEEHGCTIDDAISALEALRTRDEAARSSTTEVERLRKLVSVMADALDVADAEIAVACGMDTSPRWNAAFQTVVKARNALQSKDHSHAGR